VKELRTDGLGLAAISYDSPAILGALRRQTRDHTFPLLSEPGSATIKRYGILYTVAEEARGPSRDGPVVKSYIQKYVSPLRRTQRPECLAVLAGFQVIMYCRFWLITKQHFVGV
jgi:hypothetical protein